MQARMEALQSQINPHFLFNTLNTVSSLVRFDPGHGARDDRQAFATFCGDCCGRAIVRATAQENSNFSTIIWISRWCASDRDKLRIVKEIDARASRSLVPSIILQPLVENSIKHGFRPKSRAAPSTCARGWPTAYWSSKSKTMAWAWKAAAAAAPASVWRTSANVCRFYSAIRPASKSRVSTARELWSVWCCRCQIPTNFRRRFTTFVPAQRGRTVRSAV